MESTMKVRARIELDRAVAGRVVLAKRTFHSRTAKFDGSHRNLLFNFCVPDVGYTRRLCCNGQS